MWSPYPFLITETMDKYLLALCDTSLVGHAILPLSLYIVNDSPSFITAALIEHFLLIEALVYRILPNTCFRTSFWGNTSVLIETIPK